MLANFFESHGQFCAKYPWEVIVAVLTLTACMLSMDNSSGFGTSSFAYSSPRTEETNAVDVIFMTIIRCIAVLYSYYQFRKLRKLGSNYILGIAGLFTVFSSFVFSSTVINILRTDVSDLKDALFFFVLVIDLSKASVLAQFALRSSNQKEVNHNIARGMALLGPTITLDTLVGTLVISVGTLSGVKRLETLCWFACFSFVVNYFVFMTFYPACLSLVLELSRCGSCGAYEKGACFELKSPLAELLYDEGHKPNPVVQRVKVIMSAGMMIVHAHSRWSLNNMENNDSSKMFPVMSGISGIPPHTMSETEAADFQSYLLRFLAMSTDHIVILILIVALTVKYIFFDDKEEFSDPMLQKHRQSGLLRVSNLAPSWTSRSAENKYCQTERQDRHAVNTQCQTDTFTMVGTDTNGGDRTLESIHTQTDLSEFETEASDELPSRSVEECKAIYMQQGSAKELTDNEICNLVCRNVIRAHQLEKVVEEPVRGVGIRRRMIGDDGHFRKALKALPYRNYDYTKVMGACCENVIGYIPIPVGYSGPLLLDGNQYYVPMATTEGCLVASTNRGCRAIFEAGGASSQVVFDGMTRGPVVRFLSIKNASEALLWINDAKNFETIKTIFDATSRYARLKKVQGKIAGRHLFIRFTATTGDAMGMNMISKGTETALKYMQTIFSDMEIVSLSGNFCTDKKSAAINWIEGRGKGVVCEATIPHHVVKNVLKTSAQAMVDVNMSKNMVGSAVAGSIGGFNAHAANIVTAVFISTGQDPAQNVCSSNCMTLMETRGEDGNDLYISCTMPSIEIGTVGGGTALPAQSSCLDMLGVKGANDKNPGDNAKTLARIVCGTVLAGELSLMAALTEGHLVQSHLTLNRTSHSDLRKNGLTTNSGTSVGKCISN